MRKLLICFLVALSLSTGSILSHGYSGNCSEECNDYYCPSEHQIDKKEKIKNNNPSRK